MTRPDPYGRFNFLVEIDGVATAGFSEVSGLAAEIEPIDYREGSDPMTVRKLPGVRKFTNVTLKRGLTANRDLWQWFKTGLEGALQRRTVRIALLDDDRTPVARWTLRAAWISKWEGPQLMATGSDVAIEAIELVHEGFDLE
jgi:phage tail-like protein